MTIPAGDFTESLRQAIAESRAAGLDESVRELEKRTSVAYTTSSEYLGAVGEAITAFLRLSGRDLPPATVAKFRSCLAEVGKVWPKYRPTTFVMEERMNIKRWLLASGAVFVVILVLEFVIHGVLLQGIYQQTASVWRTQADMQRLMWIFWVGYLVFAPFFALIYAKGYEKGKPGLGQGFRFGLYVGAMLSVVHSYGWYVILPIPLVLSCYWFAAILVESIAAGIAAGLVYY